MSLAGYSLWGRKESDMADWLWLCNPVPKCGMECHHSLGLNSHRISPGQLQWFHNLSFCFGSFNAYIYIYIHIYIHIHIYIYIYSVCVCVIQSWSCHFLATENFLFIATFIIIHNQFNLASYIALMPNYLPSLMFSYSLTQNFISRNPDYSSLYYILVIVREPAVVRNILEKNNNNNLSAFSSNLQHFLFQKGFQNSSLPS